MVEQPFLASNDSFFGAFDELLAIFLWKKICLNRLGKMFFLRLLAIFYDTQLKFCRSISSNGSMAFFKMYRGEH